MPIDEKYEAQVRLLLGIMPSIAEDDAFALKGGTAINLFHRDLPRLSVDIDLAYVKANDWGKSMSDIARRLPRIAESISASPLGLGATVCKPGETSSPTIIVEGNGATVKVEVSPVMLGTVNDPVDARTSGKTEEKFGFVEARVLAFADLYAGKIRAAMERQDSRDLFDVKYLYDNEGLTEDLFRTFLVYAVSAESPTCELLAPPVAPTAEAYRTRFEGMTDESVELDTLVKTQKRLHADVMGRLTGKYREFLLSFNRIEPNFDLIDLPSAANLPAVKFKLDRLDKVKREDSSKYSEQHEQLGRLLDG